MSRKTDINEHFNHLEEEVLYIKGVLREIKQDKILTAREIRLIKKKIEIPGLYDISLQELVRAILEYLKVELTGREIKLTKIEHKK